MDELETLVHRLESLLHLLAAGQQVEETDLLRTAEQAYEYVRVCADNPLSTLQAKVLVMLSTAPDHPAINSLRTRAQGALDMYARLTSPGQQPQQTAKLSPSPDTPSVSSLAETEKEAELSIESSTEHRVIEDLPEYTEYEFPSRIENLPELPDEY